MAKGTRIMLVSVEDLNYHMYAKVSARKTDRILVFAKDEEIPDGLKEKFQDVKAVEKLPSGMDILAVVKEQASENDAVDLIGDIMSSFFEDIKEELLNICKEVGVNATFGVTNVKTYRRECKQMGFVDSSLDDIAESMGEIFTKAETVEKALKPETKSSTKTKTIVKEVNLRHLEDQIFGNKTGISELVEKITPLRDAKANLVAMLYERLCEHLKEKEALNKSECFQMLGLLHKTEEKELFNQSWRIIKPNTKLLFNDRDYIRLKSEAEYYKKVCQLLYEEDVFDD